eukprot:1445468-Karenia_brevis.AAC.1
MAPRSERAPMHDQTAPRSERAHMHDDMAPRNERAYMHDGEYGKEVPTSHGNVTLTELSAAGSNSMNVDTNSKELACKTTREFRCMDV